MIGIDSNILIRWVLPDPTSPEQSMLAERLFADHSAMIVVNPVVLAEAIWTLAKVFKVDRAEQVGLVRRLLLHPRIVFADRQVVEKAASAFENGGAGLADHLIGALNAAANCRTTLTFDKAAAKGPHFTLLT